MPMNPCSEDVASPDTSLSRRLHRLLAMLVLGAGISLILYFHGAGLWYAPLALLAIVVAHVVVLGGFAWIAARVLRSHAERADDGQGMLILMPRLYDWLVRIVTLGREKKFRHRILDLVELNPGARILDVGCGTGSLLIEAAERIGPSGVLCGVEPAAEMIAYAQLKAQHRGVDLQLAEGSAANLPHASSSFDVVFCTLALHHVPRALREDAVREMCRVLRPGGRVVIVDLQRPGALGRVFSLVSLLHNHGSAFDVLDIEPLMTQLGYETITRHSFGIGAVGAVVGQLGAGVD